MGIEHHLFEVMMMGGQGSPILYIQTPDRPLQRLLLVLIPIPVVVVVVGVRRWGSRKNDVTELAETLHAGGGQ